jgi:hypothetical protein
MGSSWSAVHQCTTQQLDTERFSVRLCARAQRVVRPRDTLRPTPTSGQVTLRTGQHLVDRHSYETYVILLQFQDATAEEQKMVLRVANEWAESANLRFVSEISRSERAAMMVPVSIRRDVKKGHCTTVDENGRPTSVSLGLSDEDFSSGDAHRVILHEFGHVLGFQHDHRRPADEVRYNESALIQYCKDTQGWDEAMTRSQILTPLPHRFRFPPSLDRFNDFDRASIMTYDLPAGVMADGVALPVNDKLSKRDKELAAYFYPYRESNVAATSVPKPNHYLSRSQRGDLYRAEDSVTAAIKRGMTDR